VGCGRYSRGSNANLEQHFVAIARNLRYFMSFIIKCEINFLGPIALLTSSIQVQFSNYL
jgi:hypothetical protein